MAYAIMLFLLVAVTGALTVITPWLMPGNECFAVAVPLGERENEPLKGYMRSYARVMVVCVALCLAALAIVLATGALNLDSDQGATGFSLAITAAMLVPVVVSFGLMLHYRKLVQEVKAQRGWAATAGQSAAYVSPEEFPKPISVAWNLLYIPLIALLAGAAFALYDRFPAQIPMNVGFNGTVTRVVEKTPGTVLFPVLLAAFIGLIMVACHVGIVHSKKAIDPAAPASSALAYGRFARLQSIILVAGGLLLSAASGVCFLLSSLEVISLNAAAIILIVVTFVFVIGIAVISVMLGQSGARVIAQPAGASGRQTGSSSGAMMRDDDKYWPLGVFYFNREEPSVFVPKRFGVGWTINLGQPLSWLAMVALVIAVIIFTIGISALVS